MQFDPARRLSAEDALKHKFFTSGPPPTPAAQLPRTLPTQSGPVQLPLTVCHTILVHCTVNVSPMQHLQPAPTRIAYCVGASPCVICSLTVFNKTKSFFVSRSQTSRNIQLKGFSLPTTSNSLFTGLRRLVSSLSWPQAVCSKQVCSCW